MPSPRRAPASTWPPPSVTFPFNLALGIPLALATRERGALPQRPDRDARLAGGGRPLLGHVAEAYFAHHAVLAWVEDVGVVRGEKYV